MRDSSSVATLSPFASHTTNIGLRQEIKSFYYKSLGIFNGKHKTLQTAVVCKVYEIRLENLSIFSQTIGPVIITDDDIDKVANCL